MKTLSWGSVTQVGLRRLTRVPFILVGFCILLSALQLLSFALGKPLEILFPHIFRLPLVGSGCHRKLTVPFILIYFILFYFKVNEMPPACEWSLTVKHLCKDDCRGSTHTLSIHTGNPMKNTGYLRPCAHFRKGLSCKGTPTTPTQAAL